jgi:hypothetical protein
MLVTLNFGVANSTQLRPFGPLLPYAVVQNALLQRGLAFDRGRPKRAFSTHAQMHQSIHVAVKLIRIANVRWGIFSLEPIYKKVHHRLKSGYPDKKTRAICGLSGVLSYLRSACTSILDHDRRNQSTTHTPVGVIALSS